MSIWQKYALTALLSAAVAFGVYQLLLRGHLPNEQLRQFLQRNPRLLEYFFEDGSARPRFRVFMFVGLLVVVAIQLSLMWFVEPTT
ncbi:MAG: hypothetical protein QM775_01920 [Pirellulales bacterium]